MSTALPKIDQAGKPVGVAGQSRDDLDLFTVPGTEIVLSDGGASATLWQWMLLDQPPGAAASLSTPNAATTNLVNATIRGSYLVQLVVDGGALPAQVYRIIAGVQIDTPSWVTPVLNRPLRIPAKGESVEFNVESSPGAGPNSRGWAQEMDHWFRAIAEFGFGFRAQLAGVPVGSEPFYTLNFVGLTVVDAGGGVLQVTSGGSGSGLEVRNEGAAIVPGGPWSQLLFPTPQKVNPAYFQTGTNAVAQPGTGEAEIVVTAAHHQSRLHSGGISLFEPTTVNRDALTCSVQTAPNPMTLDFQSLGTSGVDTQVVADGAVFDTVALPAPLTYSLPATLGKALKLLVLAATAGGPVVADIDLVVVRTTALPIVVTNLHRDFPDRAINISLAGGLLSLDNGPLVGFQLGSIVRLYDSTGYYWVEVFCHAAPFNGVETWSVSESWRRLRQLCTLAVVPYWLNGAVSTWGVNVGGTQTLIDARQFGSVGAPELQDTALQVIDRIAGDMQWQAGVAFLHDDVQFSSANEKHLDSFGLVPATSGAPLQEASGVHGGVCWAAGRRFVADTNVDVSSFGFANTPICIAARVSMPSGKASIVAFQVLSGNPIVAVRQCLSNSENPSDSSETSVVYVPLYFGKVNVAGNALLADGRVDLRRDVAHYGQWTVACRDPSIATEAFAGVSFQSRVGNTTQGWKTAGKAIAEFGSLAAALAWHGALTGSDNLTPLSAGVSAISNVVCSIRVIGDTLETFPIHLRNNITVQGEGSPFMFVPPSQWWVDYGVPSYTWTYVNIGDGVTTQRLVFNVELKNLSIILTSYDHAVQGAGSAAIGALSIWAGDYDSAAPPPPAATWQLLGTTQNVLVENVGFDLLDVSLLQDIDYLAAIKLQDMTGPNAGGTFNNVMIRGCQTPLLARRIVIDPNKRAFNAAIYMHLTNFVQHKSITISENRFSTNSYGVLSDGLSTLLSSLHIKSNDIETMSQAGGPPATYGLYFGAGSISEGSVSDNTINLRTVFAGAISRAIRFGCALYDFTVEGNRSLTNNGTATLSACIALIPSGSLLRVRINNNQMHSQSLGLYLDLLLGAVVDTVDVSDNDFVCDSVLTTTGSGIRVSVPTTCSALKISDNNVQNFPRGVEFSAGIAEAINITDNTLFSNTSFPDSYGCSLVATTELLGVVVRGNTIREARRGIITSLPANTSGVAIDGNNIACQFDTVASGSFNSRGVHAIMSPTGHVTFGLSICNNTVRNVLGMSGVDTLMGGCVVVENQSGFMVSGVKVCNNDLMLHTEDADMTLVDFPALSGLFFVGPYSNLQVNNNKIVNRTVRINDLNRTRHGGICVVHDTVYIPPRNHEVQINDNMVTWCDATFTLGNEHISAGILIDAQFMMGAQVNDNTINVQSIQDAALTRPGCVHGIVTGASKGTPNGIQLLGNMIYALKVDPSTELYGICGCGIWLRGPLSNVIAQNNTCFGYFRKTTIGAACNVWGAISANVFGDFFDMIQNVVIKNNQVNISNGDGAANGPQNLSNGIRVGSGSLSGDIGYECSVSGNNVVAYLDATGSAGLNPAGIALIASTMAGNTSCGQLLQVSGNTVNRVSMNGTTVDGLLNHGWREAQINDNIVQTDVVGVELLEIVYAGAVASNIWTNNRAGTAASPGLITLANPPYRPQPAVNNWNGLAFV